jgi:hypothetical protein
VVNSINSVKTRHPVWRSKLAALAWIINEAIDNGNYDIPIDDVRKVARDGHTVRFMQENLPGDHMLNWTFLTPEDESAINDYFERINGNLDMEAKNKGLCLLLAWTIEMMQHAGGPGDDR